MLQSVPACDNMHSMSQEYNKAYLHAMRQFDMQEASKPTYTIPVAEFDRLKADRDAFRHAQKELAAELEKEREALCNANAEVINLKAERDEARKERDEALAKRDSWIQTSINIATQRDRFIAERDEARAELAKIHDQTPRFFSEAVQDGRLQRPEGRIDALEARIAKLERIGTAR